MSGLTMPLAAIRVVVDEVRRYGAVGVETGAMLLAAGSSGSSIDTVALLGDRGIERHSDLLIISGLAVAALFDWADACDHRVLVQLHSHGLRALMSDTDRRFGLTVEGFTSAIIPHAVRASEDPSVWGWWRFLDGRWTATAPATVSCQPTRVVVFDEGGVRG